MFIEIKIFNFLEPEKILQFYIQKAICIVIQSASIFDEGFRSITLRLPGG